MMTAVPLLADPELPASPIPPGAARLLGAGARSGKLTHLEHVPAAAGRRVEWPGWARPEVTNAFEAIGVPGPWEHQAVAADHAAAGRNVIISTPPASGKSLGYLLPALTRVLGGGTALYLSPTRALAADSCGWSPRSASRASGRRWWTATRRTASAPGPGRARRTCSPPRTCCITRCCRGM